MQDSAMRILDVALAAPDGDVKASSRSTPTPGLAWCNPRPVAATRGCTEQGSAQPAAELNWRVAGDLAGAGGAQRPQGAGRPTSQHLRRGLDGAGGGLWGPRSGRESCRHARGWVQQLALCPHPLASLTATGLAHSAVRSLCPAQPVCRARPPPLQEALDMLSAQGVRVPLVLFGHMHSQLKGGCAARGSTVPRGILRA